MASSTISYLWRDNDASKGFRSGVSIHSHTNQSHETLATFWRTSETSIR